MGGKLLNGIKSMNFNSLACGRVDGGESECFMIDRGLRKQVYHVRVAFQCTYGSSYEGDKNGDREDGSEISGGGERVEISCSLVCKDLVLCGKLEEDLRAMLGGFAEWCK